MKAEQTRVNRISAWFASWLVGRVAPRAPGGGEVRQPGLFSRVGGARGVTRPTFRGLVLLGPCVLFLLLFWSASLSAYDFYNPPLRWKPGNIPIHLQLDNTLAPRSLSDGQTSWNDVATEALHLWNAQLSRVQFTTSTGGSHGDGNDQNEAFFSSTVFGHSFGGRVLAVTTAWRIKSERVEGDTIFNTAIDWDSYGGPIDYDVVDFQRVAAHEFGHTLGLDHPNAAGQVVPALMNAIVSDLDDLTEDDIRGVRALYPPNTSYALIVSIEPPGSGTVLAQPAPDSNGLYAAGEVVTFTAQPARRNRFNFWGGDENKSGLKLTVRAVDDETITANFSTNSAPKIITPPRSQIVLLDARVTFTVRAQSLSPVSYQWQHDGVDLPGATQPSLVLYLVGHEHSGLYSVRVTNARGATTSKPARLVVGGY